MKGWHVDQCITVDAIRKIIMDSEEKDPITLTSDTSRMCGRPALDQLKIVKVSKIMKSNNHFSLL